MLLSGFIMPQLMFLGTGNKNTIQNPTTSKHVEIKPGNAFLVLTWEKVPGGKNIEPPRLGEPLNFRELNPAVPSQAASCESGSSRFIWSSMGAQVCKEERCPDSCFQ